MSNMALENTMYFVMLVVTLVVTIITASMAGMVYYYFRSVSQDFLKARIFMMAERIKRAFFVFTIGFMFIMVHIVSALLELNVPREITGAVQFFWLATLVYGTYQFFAIVSPLSGSSVKRALALGKNNR